MSEMCEGMGSFSAGHEDMPFLAPSDYDTACRAAQGILDALRAQGRKFSGVLNMGLFATRKGLRFMEFNARFGDPEAMNIMMVMDTPFLSVLKAMAGTQLSETKITFSPQASVVKYLVAPEYPGTNLGRHEFMLDTAQIEACGAHVFFASSERMNRKRYVSVGSSRCVAIGATGDAPNDACLSIEQAISENVSGELQWRREIGSEESIHFLSSRAKR